MIKEFFYIFFSCFGRPFVRHFALRYRTMPCLSVCLSVHPILSVTLVYCGQTVRRIKMKLSIQHTAHAYKILSYNHDAGIGRGLVPGRIVLDGIQLPLKRGTPNFRPMFVVAKRVLHTKWYLDASSVWPQ